MKYILHTFNVPYDDSVACITHICKCQSMSTLLDLVGYTCIQYYTLFIYTSNMPVYDIHACTKCIIFNFHVCCIVEVH